MRSFVLSISCIVMACSTVTYAQSRKAVINIGEMQQQRKEDTLARTEAEKDVLAQARVTKIMPANTLVSVTPRAEISSKRVEEGQRVIFVVVDDVVEAYFAAFKAS